MSLSGQRNSGVVGHASGWSVFPTDWGWQWSAFGPTGGDFGMALTCAEAERAARRAAEWLAQQERARP